MEKLMIHIEWNGRPVPVGEIFGDSSKTAAFRYYDTFMRLGLLPISISLPFQKDPFSPEKTRIFFDGLLPEGFTRRAVAQWMHTDEEDYLSILHGLGRECLGAVCITRKDDPVSASYECISPEQVRKLAAEGAQKSAEMVTEAHLSLTGASGKVGLYLDAKNNLWYLPKGTAPSTHILKQSHVRFADLVVNELLCMNTARRCGIATANSFVVNTGDGRDGEILYATERYDRVFSRQSDPIDGFPRPLRLHQEDFAQAMGVSAAQKYEKSPGGYMKKMFDLLRHYSADPIADQLQLWDRIVFHYLVGNTDAHIKNFSLLYSSNLKSVRLAPAYDIISTSVYEQSTRNMAFHIHGKSSLDELTEKDFRLATGETGISGKTAMARMNQMIVRFKSALEQSARELISQGFPQAEKIKDKILMTGGIRNALDDNCPK